MTRIVKGMPLLQLNVCFFLFRLFGLDLEDLAKALLFMLVGNAGADPFEGQS